MTAPQPESPSPERAPRVSIDTLQLENRELQRENMRLRADNQIVRQGDTAHAWSSVIKSIVWGGVAVTIAIQARIALVALAGKTTVATLGTDIVQTGSRWTLVAWGVAGVSIAYGIIERQLRQRTLARQQNRPGALERRIDPGRTSSELTERGETHPRDR